MQWWELQEALTLIQRIAAGDFSGFNGAVEAAQEFLTVRTNVLTRLKAGGADTTGGDFLDKLDARFKAEETPGWETPANRTEREYAARQARMAVEELRHKIVEYNEATAE